MKRLLRVATLVITALLSVLLVITVDASENNNAEIASTEFYALQGESFTTTIYIADGANIAGFEIHLEYDSNMITLEDVQEKKGAVQINTDDIGHIHLNYSSTESVTHMTPLVDLTFSVSNNLAPGVYDCFTIDTNENNVAYKVVEETVNGIKSKRQCPVEFDCDFWPLAVYDVGDVDLNSVVDIGDAILIRRHLAKLTSLSEYQLIFADTCYDGVIDIGDAVQLQRYLAHFKDVTVGNRVNVAFYDKNGNELVKKSVIVGDTLPSIPNVPSEAGFANGHWSLAPEQDIEPNFTNITKDFSVYARYDESVSEDMAWYVNAINTFVGGYDGVIQSNWNLPTNYRYAKDLNKKAEINWEVSNSNVFDTSGNYNQPTYDTNIVLTATIYSYTNDTFESTTVLVYQLTVKGAYSTPTKAEIVGYLQTVTNGTISTDGVSSVSGGTIDCDLNLIKKISNEQVGSSSAYEVRVDWTIENGGVYEPISQIKRATVSKTVDLLAIISFNGKPLDGDGKVYFDDVVLSAITEDEIRHYIINQVAANVAVSFSTGDILWNDDAQYGCNIKWVSQNTSLVTIEQNTVTVNPDAINGMGCPIKAQVSYVGENGVKTFELEYSVTINTANELLQAGINISPSLYYVLLNEMKKQFGINTLTTSALKNEKFVYLDLSQYQDGVTDPATGNKLSITDLTGLTYCENLYVLNISGLNITDGLSEITNLTHLEALIANNCGFSELNAGGRSVLDGMANLRLLDLSNNELTSLNSVLSFDTAYGRLKEVYLNDNKLEDISQLQKAPFIDTLALSNNKLGSEALSDISNLIYLTYLSLANNQIDDISALSNLKSLTELRLQKNRISDVGGLKNMTQLQALYLGDNCIGEITKLRELRNVEILYLNNNAALDNVDAVSNMTKLKVLNVTGNNIDNLSALIGMDTLTELYAENNSIRSFSFVEGLTNLTKLLLANNHETGDEQDYINGYLSELTELTVLTLSGKKLNSLDFLYNTSSDSNTKEPKRLVRLEIANCSLPSYTVVRQTENNVDEYVDNIGSIVALKSTLNYLDISGNGFEYDDLSFNKGSEPKHIDELSNLSNLVLLYADNIAIGDSIGSLMSMMTRIQYISMENCSIQNVQWIDNSKYYIFIDVANNPITSFEFDYIKRSYKTVENLYLDTSVVGASLDACQVPIESYNSLKALSLSNYSISDVQYIPDMASIEFLNLSETGIENFVGIESGEEHPYSLARFDSLKYLDVSQSNKDIFNKTNLEALYSAFGNKDDFTIILYSDNQVSENERREGFDAQREWNYIVKKYSEDSSFTDYEHNIVAFKNNSESTKPTLSALISGYGTVWCIDDCDISDCFEMNYDESNCCYYLTVNKIFSIMEGSLSVKATSTVFGKEVNSSKELTFKRDSFTITFNVNGETDRTSSQIKKLTEIDAIAYTPGNTIEFDSEEVSAGVLNIVTPHGGEYDEFVRWYYKDSAGNRITFDDIQVEEFYGNPRSITLYAEWKLATYIPSIASTQRWNNPANGYSDVIVFDWSGTPNGDVSFECINSITNEKQYWFDIDSANDIYLIGNPKSNYKISYICLAGYEQGTNITVHFKNFNYTGRFVSYYNNEGFKDRGVNLTIDVIGSCSINCPNNTAIDVFKNITFTGEGNMSVYGGKGADGADYGENGKAGYNAIVVDNLTVNMSGTLLAIGGSGGNGADGKNGARGADEAIYAGGKDYYGAPGENGGNGGNGGAPKLGVKESTNIEIISGNFINRYGDYGNGGNGGNGGDGGNGNSVHAFLLGWFHNPGGNGGNGGNGGSGKIPGKGGSGGTGGNYGSKSQSGQYNGTAAVSGSNGSDGKAKVSINTSKQNTISGKGTDACRSFADGTNRYSVYDNNNVGVKIKVVDAGADNRIGLPYELKITSKTNSDRCHMGGYCYQIVSSANNLYYYAIYAKVPVGYSLGMYNNSIGNGATIEWLTDNAGTGEWKWYIGKTKCGSSGTFWTLGFVAIYPTTGTSNQVDWYVGYSNVIDCTGEEELSAADFNYR